MTKWFSHGGALGATNQISNYQIRAAQKSEKNKRRVRSAITLKKNREIREQMIQNLMNKPDILQKRWVKRWYPSMNQEFAPRLPSDSMRQPLEEESIITPSSNRQSPGRRTRRQSPGRQSPGRRSPGRRSPGRRSPGRQSPGTRTRRRSPGRRTRKNTPTSPSKKSLNDDDFKQLFNRFKR